MLITSFLRSLLACNCYVLAERPGTRTAVVVDRSQGAMGTLVHRPADPCLLTTDIDHIWSAQKVSDTFGCPAIMHPPTGSC